MTNTSHLEMIRIPMRKTSRCGNYSSRHVCSTSQVIDKTRPEMIQNPNAQGFACEITLRDLSARRVMLGVTLARFVPWICVKPWIFYLRSVRGGARVKESASHHFLGSGTSLNWSLWCFEAFLTLLETFWNDIRYFLENFICSSSFGQNLTPKMPVMGNLQITTP